MLDPENAPQPTDPPDKSGGTSLALSSDDDVELDSSRDLKPTDPPENQGGG